MRRIYSEVAMPAPVCTALVSKTLQTCLQALEVSGGLSLSCTLAIRDAKLQRRDLSLLCCTRKEWKTQSISAVSSGPPDKKGEVDLNPSS